MSADVLIGIGATIIIGLIGVIYHLGHRRDEKQEEKLDAHIKEDVKVHERVTKLEVQVESMRREIGDHDSGMIKRLHHYSKAIRRLYTKLGIRNGDDS